MASAMPRMELSQPLLLVRLPIYEIFSADLFSGEKITLITAAREFRVAELFPSGARGSYTISYHCNLKYCHASEETWLLLTCVFFTQRQVLLLLYCYSSLWCVKLSWIPLHFLRACLPIQSVTKAQLICANFLTWFCGGVPGGLN